MKFFLALMFLGSISYAGIRDVGNGGAGVLVNDKPYLLDLYEAGMTAPYFNTRLKGLPQYDQRIQKLAFLSTVEKRLLSQKLTELERISPLLANQLTVGLEIFVWRLLDQDLVEIPERSPIDLTPLKVVQLANRFGSTIRISQKYWLQMDSGNRVALVLHELLYAYADLTPVGKNTFEQQSAPVREIVGYVFSPELSLRGAQGFESFSSIPRRNSKILGRFALEYVGATFDARSDLFYGVVNLFTNGGDDRWVFCNNLEVALDSSRKGATSGIVNYNTQMATVSFEDYNSPTGMQKKLKLAEEPGTYREFTFATFNFNTKNAGSCPAWVEETVRKIRALPSLP